MSNLSGVCKVPLIILSFVVLTTSGIWSQTTDCSGNQPQGGSNRTPLPNLLGAAGNVQGGAKASPAKASTLSTGPRAKPNDSQPSQHSVSLSWNASTSKNVVGYNIYRYIQGGSGGRQQLNSSPIPSTNCIDGSVQDGQTYEYWARAVNSGGVESVDSNLAVAPIPPSGGTEVASGKPIQ
jgi:hypothetical protein